MYISLRSFIQIHLNMLELTIPEDGFMQMRKYDKDLITIMQIRKYDQ